MPPEVGRQRLRVAVREDLIDFDLVDEGLVHERTLGHIGQAQRLIDAVRQHERAGSPHALQQASALLDHVPAHVGEFAASGTPKMPERSSTRRVVIV